MPEVGTARPKGKYLEVWDGERWLPTLVLWRKFMEQHAIRPVTLGEAETGSTGW